MTLTPVGDVLIADPGNNTIRKLSPTGQLTTLAGGGPTRATRSAPSTFQQYAVIYRTAQGGTPDLQVGTAPLPGHADGRGSAARFDSPGSLAVDKYGTLYVRDRNNGALRTVQSDGTVATLGRARNPCAQVTGPIHGVAFCGSAPQSIDGAGNIYSFDFKRILKTNPAGNVTVFADLSAQFDAIPGFLLEGLTGMVSDSGGTVYAVSLRSVIFKITPTGAVSVFAGNPQRTRARRRAGRVGAVLGAGQHGHRPRGQPVCGGRPLP